MHIEYKQKVDSLRTQCLGQKYQKDLMKIWSNVANKYIEMDKEMVNCRIKRKLTPKYETLAKELDTLITALEKRILWVNLL